MDLSSLPVIRVESLDDPRIAPYRNVPDAELLREHGLFVAEGRLVVRTLLTASPLRTGSVLITPAAWDSLGDILAPRADLPIYVVPQAVMNGIAGFNIHRGCLALGERPPERSLDALLGEGASDSRGTWAPVLHRGGGAYAPRRLAVLENVSNADNVGGIFRNASAFGAAVVMGPRCCDPLYRKAIRTSMGAALTTPFASAGEWPAAIERIKEAGYVTVALTPAPDADALDAVADALRNTARIALLAGGEGAGLSDRALAAADRRVRIVTRPDVDSLNVAVAAGIALHRLYSEVSSA